MPDAPLTCTYLITLAGRVVRVSITSPLTRPVVVRFRVEPFGAPGAHPLIVATWCAGAWHVFEGTEGADPRPIIAFAMDKGHALCGPCPRDWPVVKGFLTHLAQGRSLWRR